MKESNNVADPWHFCVDPDPDLDPRIHASDQWIRIWIRILIDLQDANKNLICLFKCFLLITF
jgi:hypothetical protein